MNVLLIRLLFRHDNILKYYLYLNERKIAIFGPISEMKERSDFLHSFLSFDHHIDDDRYGENQNIIGTRNYIHTIGIGLMKPFFGDLGHELASLVDLIFMIQNIAFNFHILSTGDMNVKTLAKRRDQYFLDCVKLITLAVYSIRILTVHNPF